MTINEVYQKLLKEFPDVLDVTQVSSVIGASTKLTYRLLNEGKIKSLKIGRAFKVPKHYLLQYLSNVN
jgi:excisionase family DNA binding protein